ncbi:MAG: hypothetical protein AB7S86_14515 [Hydrogenophaga sp.]|uniref:hypothetical protein n=1 Tax=Hydrogenophaga sp. TaxID=1904254 RepID=UPI003D119171
MKRSTIAFFSGLSMLAVLSAGCSSPLKQGEAESASARSVKAPDAAPSAAPVSTDAPRVVKSTDGSYEGEVWGVASPKSKFAKLRIGMSMGEVQDIMDRAPDRTHSHETGKRWIPFYFGSDARRMQVLYKDEGCLAFTGGNIWGAAGGELVQIHNDTSGACYQP